MAKAKDTKQLMVCLFDCPDCHAEVYALMAVPESAAADALMPFYCHHCYGSFLTSAKERIPFKDWQQRAYLAKIAARFQTVMNCEGRNG